MNCQSRYIFLLVAIIWIPNLLLSQTKFSKTATCQNLKFDKRVDSYLSYTAPVIGVKEAYTSQTKITFLDARELVEFNVSHIPNARYVGYDHFDVKLINDLPKDKSIVVYCSIGYRSEKIATKLRKLGYTKVYNLYGSLFEWANQGYGLSDKSGQPTLQIHTYNKSWSQWVTHPKVIKKY
jgi:rhodanese-related sulfurtransferase